jgi:hypothetical protein
MNPLGVVPHPEGPDQACVQARHEASRARRRDQEVDRGDGSVAAVEAAPDSLDGQRDTAGLKTLGELVNILIRADLTGSDEKVSLLDPAVQEEAAPYRIVIAKHVGYFTLSE